MTARRASLALPLLVALLAGCGGGDSDREASAPPTATSTPAEATPTSTPSGDAEKPEATPVKLDAKDVKKDGKVSADEIKLVSAAVNRISAECVKRRKSKGKVGRPSEDFRDALDVLLAQFEDTSDKGFKRTGQSKETTMQATLERLGNTLARRPPKGCGANSNEGGGTTTVRRKVRAALRSDNS